MALGSIYAIAAAGIVVTYVSAGLINFAFGSMAYVVARVYYWLNVQLAWPTPAAAVVSLLVVAPALGTVLWALLFRGLRDQPQLIRIVATIGLSVALPPLTIVLFGNTAIPQAPGLGGTPPRTFSVLGAVVNLNQIYTYAAVLVVVVAGSLVLTRTSAGLRVRALVDSEALTSMSGVNPSRVGVSVWALSGVLAGLAGILVAPTNGLTVEAMTTLMAAAFAAVVAARLRSLPVAVGVALLIGLVTDIVQKYLPPSSSFSAAVLPSIPFAFILVFLAVYTWRGGQTRDQVHGGSLDQAIRPAAGAAATGRVVASAGYQSRHLSALGTVSGLVPMLILAILPAVLGGYWLGLVAQGMAFAVIFLSYVLVTGEGGMIWLCQATFAGGGAIATAQLVTVHHWALLPAVLVTAVGMGVLGVLVALATLRLGDLFVSLVTLSLGLLVEMIVFTLNVFDQYGAGVTLDRPGFATDDLPFAYLCLAILLLFGAITVNLRRSTAGLALSAVRTSPSAARTIGLSVVQSKVLVSGLGAGVAAIGGALAAMYSGTAVPKSFSTVGGLVWLAVVVTVGVRSVTGAVIAGLIFTILPAVCQTYLSGQWAQLPSIGFGIGAMLLVANPDGVVAMHARQLRGLVGRLLRGRTTAPSPAHPPVPVQPSTERSEVAR
ncbi:branched-chain amino acid ABC transporter permease [Nocardia alni]|uniref:branched-chain amino acid ABC transporter permease n=1 Tax=Nocardia alni TaxID=2815723 RepID=UPI001C23C530